MEKTPNPIDELARESENLRRAMEKAATAATDFEIAERVLSEAREKSARANLEVTRFRERVKKLAASLG